MSCLLRGAAAVVAVSAVLTVASPPARADGVVSAFFVGTPRRGFGFVTGYGDGRYGSMLYMANGRQTYASGYVVGRHSYLGGTFYRTRRFGVGFGGYYRPGFSASSIWILPGRRR
jgi:hypothetical protein